MPKEERRKSREERRQSREETQKMLRKKKKKKKVNIGLTRKDVEYLQQHTRYNEQEIIDWYRLVNINLNKI